MRLFTHFLNVFDDLHRRIDVEPRNEYELLQSSGLIRQLIKDNPPLIERVNETIRVPISFKVTSRVPEPIRGLPQAAWQWMNPNPLGRPHTVVTLEELKARPVIRIAERDFNIGEVVAVCANKLGAVHFDETMSGGQRALMEFDESATLNDVGMLAETLNGLGGVIVEGLVVLRDEVRRRRT